MEKLDAYTSAQDDFSTEKTPSKRPKKTALYVHWPWCKQKCPYCDFNAHTLKTDREKEYFSCLYNNLKSQIQDASNRSLTSIFWGGGTPSLISPAQIKLFLEDVLPLFQTNLNASQTEITLEINPSSQKDLYTYLDAGVNRFSIGVQSFSDKNLSFLGREHHAEETYQFVRHHTKGLANISIDLIYGLPTQTLTSWQKELDKAIDLGVQHISAYQLTIEPNSLFFGQVQKGHWQPLDDDTLAEFIQLTQETLIRAGYINYEISNFAKPGFECRHNTHIWKYRDYFGIGAGAHGRHQKNNQIISTRCYRMPETYMQHSQKNKSVLFEEKIIPSQEAIQEAFMLGLRLAEGVNISEWPPHLQKNFFSEAIDHSELEKFCKLGFIHKNGPTYTLTSQGWLLLDELLKYILPTIN